MKKALIIGIDDYPGMPLGGCVNDANSIEKLLRKNGDGTTNFSVKVRKNIPTKSELMGHVKRLFSGDCDSAVFYFAGHGIFDKHGGGILVTPDYKENDEGVTMDIILNIANESSIKNRVIILDCCHSGAFGSPKNLGGVHSKIAKGVTILASSRSDEPSEEANGHGVFTSLLISALQGGASDLSGNITSGGIYAYIDRALDAWDQRPIFKTNVTEFNPIRTVDAPIARTILQKLGEYFIDADHELPLNPSFEDTNDPSVKHEYVEPYADKDNIVIFKDLQKLEGVGLVVPVDEEHMYFAAMNSKACALTKLGKHYWRLVKENKL